MTPIEWNPEPRTLRSFGTLSGLLLALIGAWVFFRHAILGISLSAAAARSAGLGIWAAGAAMFVLGIFLPRSLRLIHVGMSLAAYPVGWVVSHLILLGIFYLVLTPIGLVFRWIGRDALQRKFDPKAKTYWSDHPPAPPADRYFRQY